MCRYTAFGFDPKSSSPMYSDSIMSSSTYKPYIELSYHCKYMYLWICKFIWQNSEVRNLHKWKGCLQVLWLIANVITSSIPLLYSVSYSTGKINQTLITCNMILIKELILLWLSGFQCRRIVKWICIQKQWLYSFQVWIPCSCLP